MELLIETRVREAAELLYEHRDAAFTHSRNFRDVNDLEDKLWTTLRGIGIDRSDFSLKLIRAKYVKLENLQAYSSLENMWAKVVWQNYSGNRGGNSIKKIFRKKRIAPKPPKELG